MATTNVSRSRVAALAVFDDAFAEQTDQGRAGTDAWGRGIAQWIVDALLSADAHALEQSLDSLRDHARATPPDLSWDYLRGLLAALAEVARAAADRAQQQAVRDSIDPKSWAANMLLAIENEPGCTSTRLLEVLQVSDASQVSRSGRVLLERGLAVAAKAGRFQGWNLTPRGNALASELRSRLTEKARTTEEIDVGSLQGLKDAVDQIGRERFLVGTTSDMPVAFATFARPAAGDAAQESQIVMVGTMPVGRSTVASPNVHAAISAVIDRSAAKT